MTLNLSLPHKKENISKPTASSESCSSANVVKRDRQLPWKKRRYDAFDARCASCPKSQINLRFPAGCVRTTLSPVNKKEQLLSKQNVGQLAVSPVIFHFLEISAAECFQYCTVCYSIPISTNSHRCRPQCLHRIPGISIAFVEASVKVKYFHVYGNDNPLKRGKKTSTCI